VLALITFLLMEILAEAAGLFGIWLAIVIVPAYFRYLLHLLDSKANGRDAPSPGIELFNWVENFWSLFPLVLVCLVIWGEYFLAMRFPPMVAAMPGALIVFLFPASMVVLALTRSPVQSLNPVAVFRIVRSCGRDYFIVPLVIIATFLLIWYLVIPGTPYVLTKAAALYASFLLFTLTGGVLYTSSEKIQVEMLPPLEPTAEQLDAALTDERTKVLNHAYAFISRGNRQGGLQHICQWIGNEAAPDLAYRWFFEQMLQWDSTEAALILAQAYLTRLLDRQRDVEAMKLIRRCLIEDERFKPLPEDRHAALAAAGRLGNDDLARYLGEG
jgi:hypothetical protein